MSHLTVDTLLVRLTESGAFELKFSLDLLCRNPSALSGWSALTVRPTSEWKMVKRDKLGRTFRVCTTVTVENRRACQSIIGLMAQDVDCFFHLITFTFRKHETSNEMYSTEPAYCCPLLQQQLGAQRLLFYLQSNIFFLFIPGRCTHSMKPARRPLVATAVME